MNLSDRLPCGCLPGYFDCPIALALRKAADRQWNAYAKTGSLVALRACRAKLSAYRRHHEAHRIPNAG